MAGVQGSQFEQALGGGLLEVGAVVVEGVAGRGGDGDQPDEAELGVAFGQLSFAPLGVGEAFAFAGVAALLAQDMTRLPRTGQIGVDLRVLVFALAVSLLASAVVGTFPAFRAARRDPRDALADNQRIQGGSAATRRMSATTTEKSLERPTTGMRAKPYPAIELVITVRVAKLVASRNELSA